MSNLTTHARLAAIIAAQMEIDAAAAMPTAGLRADLGAEPLDIAEILIAAEEEFDIEIFAEVDEQIVTVADLVRVIETELAHGSAKEGFERVLASAAPFEDAADRGEPCDARR